MHYYRHHIGDFIRDTARLSDSQCMAYMRLIWMYYDTEKPLINDAKVLAFKIGADESDVSLILSAYFNLQNEEWVHTRCEKEIDEYSTYVSKQKEKGKLGGRPRKNPQETRSFTTDNPQQSSGEPAENPNHYPLTTNQEPVLKETTPRKTRTPAASGIQFLLDAGIDDQLANDYMQVRKGKGAKTLSQTAFNSLVKESAKAGIDLSLALQHCVKRNWVGFEADWLTNKPQTMQNQKDASRSAAAASIFKPEYTEHLMGGNNERAIN